MGFFMQPDKTRTNHIIEDIPGAWVEGELAAKIERLWPFFNIVTNDIGELVDVKDDPKARVAFEKEKSRQPPPLTIEDLAQAVVELSQRNVIGDTSVLPSIDKIKLHLEKKVSI